MEIVRCTLAVTDMDAVVAFYNAVFDAGIEPVGDGPFHVGMFCGINILLCPNEIAEVDARQGRHQFRLRVDDLDAVLQRVPASGGAVLHVVDEDGERVAGVRDPDGNTYELVESAPVR